MIRRCRPLIQWYLLQTINIFTSEYDCYFMFSPAPLSTFKFYGFPMSIDGIVICPRCGSVRLEVSHVLFSGPLWTKQKMWPFSCPTRLPHAVGHFGQVLAGLEKWRKASQILNLLPTINQFNKHKIHIYAFSLLGANWKEREWGLKKTWSGQWSWHLLCMWGSKH